MNTSTTFMLFIDHQPTSRQPLWSILAQWSCHHEKPKIQLFFREKSYNNRDLYRDIVIYYKYCLYLEGYYQKNLEAPAVIYQTSHKIHDKSSHISGKTEYYYLPESPENPDLKWLSFLDPTSVEIVNSKTQHNPPSFFGLNEAFRYIRQTAETCMNLPVEHTETFWGTPEGASYRFAQDLELWRYGLLSVDQTFVAQLIRAGWEIPADDPKRWGIEAALLLYKRIIRHDLLGISTPNSPDEEKFRYLQTYRPKLKRCLEILPYVQNFTVTILLLTHNRPATLRRAVNSVLNQTVTDWKLIIGDDASQDQETETYCRQLEKNDPRVRYIRHPHNIGHAHNFDTLADQADTELIIGLADDDWLSPNYLESTLSLWKKKPWLGVIIVPCKYANEKESVVNQFGPFYHQTTVADPQRELQRAAAMGAVYLCGFVYRKALLQEMAPYDLFPKKSSDFRPKYAMSDCSIAAYCLGHFETGIVHNAFLYFSVWNSGASSQRDTTEEHLGFFEMLWHEYEALFGTNSFPAELTHYVFNIHILEYVLIKNFKQKLMDNTVFFAHLENLKQIWHHYLEMRTHFLSHANPDIRPLVTPATARGLNIWGGHYTLIDRVRRRLSPIKQWFQHRGFSLKTKLLL